MNTCRKCNAQMSGTLLQPVGNGEYECKNAYACRERQKLDYSGKGKRTPKKTIQNGDAKITLHYHDGEYLSGYTTYDGGELLEKIGLAKYVSGWGYYVKDEISRRLGNEFIYAQAYEMARPALEEAEDLEKARKLSRDFKFLEARNTGRPVLLSQYTDECNDPREECSLDNVYVYAMPDGKTRTERHHTW